MLKVPFSVLVNDRKLVIYGAARIVNTSTFICCMSINKDVGDSHQRDWDDIVCNSLKCLFPILLTQ